VSVSDKPKQSAPPVKPGAPKPPPPKPDTALITYIERGRKQKPAKPRH
jgi:hypothetical protein